jgi:hypothetical protein
MSGELALSGTPDWLPRRQTKRRCSEPTSLCDGPAREVVKTSLVRIDAGTNVYRKEDKRTRTLPWRLRSHQKAKAQRGREVYADSLPSFAAAREPRSERRLYRGTDWRRQ